MWVERHRRVAIQSFAAIVLDPERHRVGIGFDQSPVRDGDTVRIARQVGPVPTKLCETARFSGKPLRTLDLIVLQLDSYVPKNCSGYF